MSLEDLFATEVLRWRYAGALGTVLAVQAALPLMLCAAFRILVIDQIWNPVSALHQLWASSWIMGLFWPSLCLLVLTRIHVHNYTVTGQHSVRVWHVARTLFRVHTLCVFAGVSICTCVLMQLYAATAHGDFASVVRPCYSHSSGSQICINSRTLVVVMCGIYCGVLHAAHYTLGNGNLVTMAAVSVPKKQRIRALLSPRSLLRRVGGAVWGTPNSGGVGVKTILGVVILYALMGGIVEQWVATVLGGRSTIHDNNPLSSSLHQEIHPHSVMIDSIASLVNPSNLETKDELMLGAMQRLEEQGQDGTFSTSDSIKINHHEEGGTDQINDVGSKNKSSGNGEDGDSGKSSWYILLSSWQRLEVLTDPMLLLVLLLSMTLNAVMMQLFYDIFAVFVMQPISLPVTPPPTVMSTNCSPQSPPAPDWVLGAALQASSPTLRVLAYQQLSVLATTGGSAGQAAREPVFAISHPGGHPRNWNTLLNPTLTLIQEFTGKLMKQNCPEEFAASQLASSATVGNTAAIIKDGDSTTTLGGNASILGRTAVGNITMNGTTTVGNTSIQLNNTVGNTSILGGCAGVGNTSFVGGGNTSIFGNTTIGGNTSMLLQPKPPVSTKPTVTEGKKESLIAALGKKIFNKLKEKLSVLQRLPVVRQLLAEIPDAGNTNIFAEAQPVVFAVLGLCGLVTASFSEDQFGVVQRNMPQIMTALLQLNVALDKTGRPPLPKRVSSCGQHGVSLGGAGTGGVGVVGGSSAPHHTRLRRGVRLTLRTALYRLSHTFGSTLLDVPLPSNLKTKVHSYLDLMEG